MSEFYKMNPAKWNNGTAALTLEQEAAYLRIVNAIHLYDEDVPDNDWTLGGMFRCSPAKARRLVNDLLKAEKISTDGTRITNRRAADDLSTRSRQAELRASAGQRGGIASGQIRRAQKSRDAKPLKHKTWDEAFASDASKRKNEATKQNRIEENRREEKDNPLLPHLLKHSSVPEKPTARVAETFEQFWKSYPKRSPNASKLRARKEWQRLHGGDQEKALASLPVFGKWLATQRGEFQPVHPERYLSQRRFDGFVEGQINGLSNGTPLDWKTLTRAQYETLVFAAKRRGEWCEAWGPTDKIPAELMDDELRKIC